jgi:hypothetical protein
LPANLNRSVPWPRDRDIKPHSRLLERFAAVASDRSGRRLLVNVTDAIQPTASDMDYRLQVTGGCALIAPTLGALAHIPEAMDESSPIG